MLQRAALALAIVLLFGGNAIAEDTSVPAPPATDMTAAPVDSHLAAAIDLLVATNAKATMASFLDTMMPVIMDAIRKSSPQASQQSLDAFRDTWRGEMMNSMDDMLKLEAQIYVQHFSEDELRALTSFYRSDVGQKYLSELPSVMKETVPLGETWGRVAAEKAARNALEKLRKNGVQL